MIYNKYKRKRKRFKGCRKIKSISNNSACYDIIFSVGGIDLDLSDPLDQAKTMANVKMLTYESEDELGDTIRNLKEAIKKIL